MMTHTHTHTTEDIGTVGLQFPPPTVDSVVAIKWMRLAVSFVAALANPTDPTMPAPTIGGLRALLQSADRDADPLEDILEATGV